MIGRVVAGLAGLAGLGFLLAAFVQALNGGSPFFTAAGGLMLLAAAAGLVFLSTLTSASPPPPTPGATTWLPPPTRSHPIPTHPLRPPVEPLSLERNSSDRGPSRSGCRGRRCRCIPTTPTR